jgi:hypothetical protein
MESEADTFSVFGSSQSWKRNFHQRITVKKEDLGRNVSFISESLLKKEEIKFTYKILTKQIILLSSYYSLSS